MLSTQHFRQDFVNPKSILLFELNGNLIGAQKPKVKQYATQQTSLVQQAPKRLEHGHRMICDGCPSLLGFGVGRLSCSNFLASTSGPTDLQSEDPET